MEYKYITDNNLENKQNYMYSEFGGIEFLDAYKKSRADFISKTFDSRKNHCTREEILDLNRALYDGEYDRVQDLLDAYVKRFEVSKRLYTEYNDEWKVLERAGYEQYDLYIVLSDCCLRAYEISRCTKYLSCALKIDDTLLSLQDYLTQHERKELSRVLGNELMVYEELATKLEVEE